MNSTKSSPHANLKHQNKILFCLLLDEYLLLNFSIFMVWEKIHDLLLLFIYKFIEEAELLLVAFHRNHKT